MNISKWRTILPVILAVALFSTFFTTQACEIAYADEERNSVYFDAPNKEIEDEVYDKNSGIVDVKTSDLESPDAVTAWLADQKSFVLVKNINGTVSYYFNTPNLQKSLVNSIQSINSGGWKFASNDKFNEKDEWVTAAIKYGYTVPAATYLGEYPAPQLKAEEIAKGMANPINGAKIILTGIVNWVGDLLTGIANFFLGIFDMEVDSIHLDADLADTTLDDIKGVRYNTNDYVDSTQDEDKAIAKWLEDNWYFMENNRYKFEVEVGSEKLFDKGVVVYDGETVGGGEGQLHGLELLNRIIKKSGKNYTYLLDKLISLATDEKEFPGEARDKVRVSIYRHMPYELSSMSPASAKYMNNISDPRVESFKNSGDPGTFYMVDNTIASFLLNIKNFSVIFISGICSAADTINTVASMDFIKNTPEIDLFYLWKGSVAEFIILLLAIAIVVVAARAALSRVGTSGGEFTLSKTITSVICIVIIGALLVNPTAFENVVVDLSSKIISVGTNFIEDDQDFKEFYVEGEANSSDKTSLKYWLMYFNAWSIFTTNHSIFDEANDFDPSQNTNEYVLDFQSTAELKDGNKIDNWAAVLLQSEFTHSLDAYRATDHYLAPTIKPGTYPEFEVESNKFYNGYMFSTTPFGVVFLSLSVLLLTLLKALCFIEFIYNIMMLFIKLTLGSVSGTAEVKNVFKELGLSLLKVIVYDLMLTFCIYISFTIADNNSMTIIGMLVFVGVIALIGYLYKNNTFVFSPQIFRTIDTGITSLNGVHKNDYELYDNISEKLGKKKRFAKYTGEKVSNSAPVRTFNNVKDNVSEFNSNIKDMPRKVSRKIGRRR